MMYSYGGEMWFVMLNGQLEAYNRQRDIDIVPKSFIAFQRGETGER